MFKLSYKQYQALHITLATGMIIYAVNIIYRFLQFSNNEDPISNFNIGEIIFWALGPPVWFFIEYYMIQNDAIAPPDGSTKKDFIDVTKNYADIASKIWASVLATIIFMVPK